MTTNQILELDFREEENEKIIQRVLRQIKPLSKFTDDEDIPLEFLEKVVRVVCLKYEVWVQSISQDVRAGDGITVWRATLIDTTNFKSFGNVYAMCMYELFAKLSIKLHSLIRTEKLKERELSENEKARQRKARRIKM